MRSITLHTCRRICIYQNATAMKNKEYPCTKCSISGICNLFVDAPINWKSEDIEIIDGDSAAFYKFIKGEMNNGKV